MLALVLFWGVFVLDFATSASFILLGYGGAETNQFQRTLILAPGGASLLSWASNQAVWVGVGALGVAVLAASPSFVPKSYLGIILALSSFVRLYGVATNLFLTMMVFSGAFFPPVGLYMIMGALALLPFRKALRQEVFTRVAVAIRS